MKIHLLLWQPNQAIEMTTWRHMFQLYEALHFHHLDNKVVKKLVSRGPGGLIIESTMVATRTRSASCKADIYKAILTVYQKIST